MSQGKKYSNKDSLDWLKHSDLTQVLSMALGELYLAKPKNQLFFLGNWLVNHSKSKQNLNLEADLSTHREILQDQHKKSLEVQKKTEENLKHESEKLHQKENDLKSEISASLDIFDLLPKVIQHVKDRTFAAAGYIGLLEKVKRAVTDNDDDKAHIDEDSPFVLRYITASEKSEWMIGQVLKEEEGQATWSIWKEDEEEEAQDEEEGKEPPTKPKLKIVCINDVVNDPRIKFFDVPKLGSYLAAPVSYQSCLFESSFDAGVEDAIDCRKKRTAQEEERQKHESSKQEEEEPRVFEEIKEEKFRTSENKLVLALDTLGLDKVFSEDQKNYVMDWALFLKNELERSEDVSLRRDIIDYVEIKDADNQRFHDKAAEWADEEKSAADEVVKSLGPTASEEAKQKETTRVLFEVYRNRVLNDLGVIFRFKEYRIVKFARVIQLAFYLSGIDKDLVVENGTNMISWKKAKSLLDERFEDFVKELNPIGPKTRRPPVYAKTMRLEKDLQKIPFEEVQNFSISLGFLYKMLDFYFKSRVLDVVHRRKDYLSKIETREAAEAAARELYERKKKYVDDAKEAFDKENELIPDEDKPVFDPSKLFEDFDLLEGNQPIQIPELPMSDQDEDIDWEETHPSS